MWYSIEFHNSYHINAKAHHGISDVNHELPKFIMAQLWLG